MPLADDLFALAEGRRSEMYLPEAIELYSAAQRTGYDAHQCGAGRWTCYMLAGKWDRAWLESDQLDRYGKPDPHRFWNGDDCTGKHVLLRCLHGLGDTLQFVRYAPLIRQSARSLTIEAQPKLKPLIASSNLADQVITWGESEPPWTVQMEVNELPRIFRTVEATVPDLGPYLLPLNTTSLNRALSSHDPLRVGLVWTASDYDISRNIPLPLLLPLLDLTDIEFFSLQAGEGWTDVLPPRVTRLSEKDTAIEQIAAEMMTLDLVLTVDTMNAHLAGGLGRRTWTMLPFQCDWRWLKDREDSPWYPTMRLFRQPSPGSWEAVIAQVRQALQVMAQQKRRQQGAE